MKILQVVTAFQPAVIYGGPSTIAAQQAISLAKRGHQVTVATSNIANLHPKQRIADPVAGLEGVDVRYFPSQVLWAHFSFIVSKELSRWLKQNVRMFDAVHIQFAREWIPVRAAQISIEKGVPTFLQPHGMLGRMEGVRRIIDLFWTKRILETAAGVFSYHSQENNEIKEITPYARILELPNGINVPNTSDEWTIERLSNPVVLFLARLHSRKRVLAFVEMARLLRDRGLDLNYRVVGDGEELADAQRLVRKYELENRVVFAGSVSSEAVAREFINSAVYVLPSINEPFPMSVLQALSLGVPTLVTDTCFIAPMLNEYGAALVSSPAPEALADSIQELLCNEELAKRLCENGRRLFKEELNIERVAQQLENYYRGTGA